MSHRAPEGGWTDPPTEPTPATDSESAAIPLLAELSAPTQVQRLAWLTPARRQYVYAVLAAVVPLLVWYGVVDAQTAALWVAAAAAVLGMGLAGAHVNSGSGQ